MVRSAATPPLALCLATATLLSAACFDTSSTITTADYPTRLTVDPLTFRGSLPCGAPGLERYVATVTNVTSGAPEDKLISSSGPVACQNLVSFGDSFILSANYYTGAIDGYDRDVKPDPAGGVIDRGRPKMVDTTSEEEVAPRWTTTCGEVERPPEAGFGGDPVEDASPDTSRPTNLLRFPTLALGKIEVILHGCLPLSATSTPDASVDGSSGAPDGSPDGEGPTDASAEGTDVADPDGGPGDEPSGDDSGTDGG
jgi:hypothetical protein